MNYGQIIIIALAVGAALFAAAVIVYVWLIAQGHKIEQRNRERIERES